MNFRIKKLSAAAIALSAALSLGSCTDDLRQEPVTDVTAASLYKDFSKYPNLLAKLYGGLAVGGQQGGDGAGDIADIDGGFSNYARLLFIMQEITTDLSLIHI